MEQKTCPKCGKSMNVHEYVFGLPGFRDPNLPKQTKDRINTEQALPLEVYVCEGCRFLELYAG